jgi:hypothetical protein
MTCPSGLSDVSQRLFSRIPIRPISFSLTVVPRLQIEPVALGQAEVMRQSVRNIRVDRALPLHDLVDSSGRKVDISGETKDADSAGGEELFEYDPSWM